MTDSRAEQRWGGERRGENMWEEGGVERWCGVVRRGVREDKNKTNQSIGTKMKVLEIKRSSTKRKSKHNQMQSEVGNSSCWNEEFPVQLQLLQWSMTDTQRCTTQNRPVLFCSILRSATLHTILLHCTALHCILLHCTAQHSLLLLTSTTNVMNCWDSLSGFSRVYFPHTASAEHLRYTAIQRHKNENIVTKSKCKLTEKLDRLDSTDQKTSS